MAKNSKKASAKIATDQADAMKSTFDKVTAFSSDFGDMARLNVEALTQSLQLAGKGMTELNTKAFGYMQANMQRNLETAQQLGGMKSLEDLSVLQDITKSGFETYVAQMNELGSLFATTLREASEPLNTQAGAIVEKFQASA